MLHTTRAIVLRTIRHGDRSTVLRAYTERAGLRSYLVRVGGRNGIQPALLSPLSRLELTVDEHAERDLHYVREARMESPLAALGDPMRSTVLLFTQEILLLTLKEESADERLFRFVHARIGAIGEEGDAALLPIRFLLDLSQHLGFQPSPPEEGEENFDLLEGCFVSGDAPGGYTLRPPLSTALAGLIGDQATQPRLSPASRRELLDHLLLFYRLHVAGFGEPRSLEVLRQVFA